MKYQTVNMKYAAGPIEGQSLVNINWDAIKQYIPSWLSSIFSMLHHYVYFILGLIVILLTSIIGMYVLYRIYLWIKKKRENKKQIEISPIEIPVDISPIEIPVETMSSNSGIRVMRFVFHPIVVAYYELRKLFTHEKNITLENIKETSKKAEIIMKNASDNIKQRVRHIALEDLQKMDISLENIKLYLNEVKKIK